MKIKLTHSDLDKLKDLIDRKNTAIDVSSLFLDFLENKKIFSFEEIDEQPYEDKEAFYNLLCDYYELNMDDEENILLGEQYIKSAISKDDVNYYLSNSYYKNIKPIEYKDKDYHLFYDHYEPYELFPLDEIKVDKDYNEISSMAFFKEKFSFLTLTRNNVTWMSITPNEIRTMEKAINDAHGNVLVYGLGLAYFPYMISLKDNVKSITIIEKDDEIISLVKKHILPFFKNGNKIKIIKSDAFVFLDKHEDNFNYTFVDLWHNPNDGLYFYLKFKKKEDKYHSQYFYWLEKSLIAYIRRLLILLIEESIQGFNDNNYTRYKTQEDKYINDLYFKTKKVAFATFNEIVNFLSDKNIKELISKN